MPPHVLNSLKSEQAKTDTFMDVTILYADICGFTLWSANKAPIEVVTMLSRFFTTFDHLCNNLNVYKVHTIGDCYVVLGFIDAGENGEKRNPTEECMNVVQLALEMIKSIYRVNKEGGLNLDMRIGIHTGKVIAGITGTSIVRYDIYGEDNDIANKMESGGTAGKINVSEITKRIIEEASPGRFDFEFNKPIVHSAANRSVDSYFLVPLRNEDMLLV